ncbi:hypothetical protein RJT34_17256 [Clitoria ternatea]|uniref:PI-PLC X domain-containing protein n=1 Tax=Clitoria ternatea TaxID=43366 RepID=A0AAN9J8W8_CLITE
MGTEILLRIRTLIAKRGHFGGLGTGERLLNLCTVGDAKANSIWEKNGVRGLMLDMYDFENDIWLCHSIAGKCFNATSFQPAINVLKDIESFMEANPSEIVTIFIEDYMISSQGLTKEVNASGLSKYWFPVSSMPKNGEDWPIV